MIFNINWIKFNWEHFPLFPEFFPFFPFISAQNIPMEPLYELKTKIKIEEKNIDSQKWHLSIKTK